MALMEYGKTAGMAYKHDFYKEIELNRARKQTQIQMEQVNMAKASLFAGMFKMGQADNPYDQRKLKKMAEKTIAEAGKYQTENPDWYTNPFKLAYLNTQGQSLINNDYTINAKVYSEQFKGMQAQLDANPQLAQQEAFIKQWQAAQNYKDFGSTDGIEANRKPFVYQAVTPWGDLNAASATIGKNFKAKTTSTNPNGWPGNYEEIIDENELAVTATQFYNENKEQFDKSYDMNKYKSPVEYAADLIRNNIEIDRKPGDYRASDAYLKSRYGQKAAAGAGAAGGGIRVPWMQVITTPSGRTSPELFKEMFGPTAQPLVQTVNGEGREDFGIRNVQYTGDYKDMGNGTVGIQVEFVIPRSEADEMGLSVKDGGWFGWQDDTGEDDIDPKYKDGKGGIAWAQKGGKDNEENLVRIKGWKVVPKNDEGLFQRSLDASKIRDAYQPTPGMINQYTNPGMRPITLSDGSQGYMSTDGSGMMYDSSGEEYTPTKPDGTPYYLNPATNTWE